MELLFATGALLAMTTVASLVYYRRIKQAQEEYEGARDMVKNITLGFSKQLSRLTGTMKRVTTEAQSALSDAREAMKTSSEALTRADESLTETKKLRNRLEETERTVESIKQDIQNIKKGYAHPVVESEVEAPIPLKQDMVLDQLTATEIELLGIIEELGEGSVPTIKDRIKKTREHTARLLKKLYENGFIDRNTSSIPYRYYIRKEIREIVQQRKKRMKIAV
ncbi:MAG: MarR family transcriptional regulator [Candidatus Bathyarchaeia archaeon]